MGRDGLTATGAAQNETLNNFLTTETIQQKEARLAKANSFEKKASIVKEYIGISRDNTNKALADIDKSVMTKMALQTEREKLVSLVTGPTVCAASTSCRADALQSISEIDGILRSSQAAKDLEPLVLGAELVLALAGGAEIIAAKYGAKLLGGAAEVTASSTRTVGGALSSPLVVDGEMVTNAGTGSALRLGEAKGGIDGANNVAGVNVWHAAPTPGAATSILENGIDPAFLSPNSRFGAAFHVAEQPETALAEMGHYGVDPTTGIRFTINQNELKLLDLTNPSVAKTWGYKGGSISSTTQQIGADAASQGFNAIRYFSERAAGGSNMAIINDFNKILKPVMVTPVAP